MISTFNAYQIAEKDKSLTTLRHPKKAQNGKELVMRLMRNDYVRLVHNDEIRNLRVCKITSGKVVFSDMHEANVDARVRSADLGYIVKTASSLQKSDAKQITVSPIGVLNVKS